MIIVRNLKVFAVEDRVVIPEDEDDIVRKFKGEYETTGFDSKT